MTKVIKTEALVLKKRSLLGRDLIVTLFTEEFGKINALGKGMKKITSRRLPHTETANLIKAVIDRRGDYFYLQSTDLLSGFTKIKKNEKKVNYLYFFFFILERMLPENQKEPRIYQLTRKFLIELSEKPEYSVDDLTLSLNRLLEAFGYLNKEKSLEELRFAVEEIINEKLPSLLV
jgi:DNA repair protein RecO (recombination protein O)